MEHMYILEPYKGISSRYTCPGCNRSRTFSLYINTQTGQPIARHVGRCNREINCGYHYTPKQYFQDNNIVIERPQHYSSQSIDNTTPLSPSTISVNVLKQSLSKHKNNSFIAFLCHLFEYEIAIKLVSKYFIGSSKKWFKSKDYPEYESPTGASVFWQIDSKGRIRTGKIMLYNPTTGKRIKEPFNHITWVHSELKEPQFNLKQCLFGEHLLRAEPEKPVAIVESEKTAIIASVYLPMFTWLAAGSLTNLNKEKCLVLAGRNVTLFPDLNGFDKWSLKANELSGIVNIHVSDLLERKATPTERQQGLDLADYLLRFDYRKFIDEQQTPFVVNDTVCDENMIKPQLIVKDLNRPDSSYNLTNANVLKNWQEEIEDLEGFFSQLPCSTGKLQLSPGSSITNLPLFIDSHLTTIKVNKGNHIFLPYLIRLQQVKNQLTTNL